MPVAALAIPAIISAGGAVAGGIVQKNAANAAVNSQVDAANAAMGQVTGARDTANKILGDATDAAVNYAGDASNFAQDAAITSAANGAHSVTMSALTAGDDVKTAASTGAQQVTDAANTANGLLDPYSKAGTDATGKLSDLANSKFTFNQNDPSYQFRLQQGQQALERSASARGGSLGGAAMKAATRYASGLASTEYGAEFNRYLAERNSSADILSGLASRGLSAAGKEGDNTIGAAKYGSDVNIDASKYAGSANIDASKFGANMNYDAAKYAGNVGIQTAEYAGNAKMSSAERQGSNDIYAADRLSDLITGAGNARAAGHIQKGNIWGGAINTGANIAGGLPWGKWFPGKTGGRGGGGIVDPVTGGVN